MYQLSKPNKAHAFVCTIVRVYTLLSFDECNLVLSKRPFFLNKKTFFQKKSFLIKFRWFVLKLRPFSMDKITELNKKHINFAFNIDLFSEFRFYTRSKLIKTTHKRIKLIEYI